MKNGGKADIRELVTEKVSYDACYSFMQWANQDDICSISVIYDSIKIYLNPEVYKMSRNEYYKLLGKKFNIRHDKHKRT